MAVRGPQLRPPSAFINLAKERYTAGIVPGQADCRVVATMHQHRSQELPFGIDFTRPEPELRRFDRAILRELPGRCYPIPHVPQPAKR